MVQRVKSTVWAETKERVDRYMDGVLLGTIPACRFTKLAVERHLRDLESGHERGLHHDPEAVQVVVDFFCLLRHSKGKWANKQFELEDWEVFILWVLFGWMKADNTRRFRTAYIEVPRKNGKSTFIAGIGLFLQFADGEWGAEVYSAATRMEQAQIIHREAVRMVKKSPSLNKRARTPVGNIAFDATESVFKPLGKNAKRLDGLNVHAGLIDELHAHPDGSVWDILDSAVGSREQPMILAITTAGFNTESFCYDQRNRTSQILQQVIEDDTWFGVIYTIDRREDWPDLEDEDDWRDEQSWAKANPNLDVTVFRCDMRRMCHKAKTTPSAENNFLTKKLNVWTTQQVKWVSLAEWKKNSGQISEAQLLGKTCFSAGDMSTNTDITSLTHVFPWDDNRLATLHRFWIPEANIKERSRGDEVLYEKWVKEGLIKATPGNVIDYETIIADMLADFERFNVGRFAFDRWGFEAIRQRLIAEGIKEDVMVSHGQGFASMSMPMKKTEELYLAHRYIGITNPVMLWMASNTQADVDPAENYKPNKAKSRKRIDGIVTTIMATGLVFTVEPKKPSVYESRGLVGI